MITPLLTCFKAQRPEDWFLQQLASVAHFVNIIRMCALASHLMEPRLEPSRHPVVSIDYPANRNGMAEFVYQVDLYLTRLSAVDHFFVCQSDVSRRPHVNQTRYAASHFGRTVEDILWNLPIQIDEQSIIVEQSATQVAT